MKTSFGSFARSPFFSTQLAGRTAQSGRFFGQSPIDLAPLVSGYVEAALRHFHGQTGGAKWGSFLGLIAVAGLIELQLGDALASAVVSMVVVGTGAWLMGGRAGLAIALLCAVVFIAVERVNPVSSPLVLAAHAGLLFSFLAGLVGILVFAKSAEHRLRYHIERQDQRLGAETARRHQLECELSQRIAAEQGMIAQHIHDELGQYVSALLYHGKMLAEDLQETSSPLAPKAERILELIRTTNEAIRWVGRGLQAPQERDDALVSTLRTLAEDFQRLTGVRCTVHSEAEPLSLDGFRSMMLFRIVREACSNAVKHGNPKTILISVRVRASMLHLEIADDGTGLAVDADLRRGTGLQTMRHRADLMGATLDIHAADVGCTVACDVPLSEQSASLNCAA